MRNGAAVDRIADAQERVIAKVGDDLHTQYLLSFQAGESEGKVYHAITVNVRRAEAVVRARPGYWPE